MKKLFRKLHINEWAVIILTIGIWIYAIPTTQKEVVWGHTAPTYCLYRNIFGAPCLGCGLSRSVILALQGHIQLSFKMHPLGIPIFALLHFLSFKYLKILLQALRNDKDQIKLNKESESSVAKNVKSQE